MPGTILRPRSLALAMYLMYIIAGVVFVFLPSNILRNESSSFALIIWHVFLLAGGLVSAMGVIGKRPAVEAIGIPLLSSALTAYGVVLVSAGFGPTSGPRIGFACLMFGTTIGLLGRMIELFRLIHIALDVENRGRDDA